MAVIGEAFVRVKPQTQGFAQSAERGVLGGLGRIAAKGALILGGIFAVKHTFNEIKELADDGGKFNKQMRLVNQAIESTGGAAKVSAEDIEKYASAQAAITGASSGVIVAQEQLLIRFTNIRNEMGKGNDIFNQTATAAQNVSASLGKGLQPVTIALGKALNDPVKGLTALGRLGIQFNAQQKEQIKTLVESGKGLEAQKVILGALEQKFGGAAAAASSFGSRLKATIENAKEQIGRAIVPAFGALNEGLIAVVPGIGKALSEAFNAVIPALEPILKSIGPIIAKVFEGIAPAIIVVGEALGDLVSAVGPVVGELGALVGAIAPLFKPIIAVAKALAETFAAAVVPVIRAFADIITSVAKSILPPLTAALAALAPALKGIGETIGATLGAVLEKLAPVIATVAGSIANVLGKAIQVLAPILPIVAEAFAKVGSVIANVGIAVLNVLIPPLTSLLDAIAPLLKPLADLAIMLADVLVGAIQTIAPSFKELLIAFGGAFQAVITAILPSLPQLADSIVRLGESLAELLVAVTPLIVALAQFATTLITSIGVPVITAMAVALTQLTVALAGVLGNVNVLGPALAFLATVWAVDKITTFGTAVFAATTRIATFFATLNAASVAEFVRGLLGMSTAVEAVGAATAAQAALDTAAAGAATTRAAAEGALDIAIAARSAAIAKAAVAEAAVSGANLAVAENEALLAGSMTLTDVEMAKRVALSDAVVAAQATLAAANEAVTVSNAKVVASVEALNIANTEMAGTSAAAAVGVGGAAASAEASGGIIAALGGPVTIVIAAVVALAAAAVLAYKNIKPFRDAVDAVGRSLATLAGVIVNAVTGSLKFIADHWKGITQLLVAPFALVPTLIVTHLDAIVEFFTSLPGRIARAVVGIAKPVLDQFVSIEVALAQLPGRAVAAFADLAPGIIAAFGKAFAQVVAAIPGFAVSLFKQFSELTFKLEQALAFSGGFMVGQLARSFITLAAAGPALAAVAFKFFASLPGRFLDALGSLSTLLIDAGEQLISGLLHGLQSAGNAAATFFANLPGQVVGAATAAADAVGAALSSTGSAVVSFFAALPNAVGSAVTAIVNVLAGVSSAIISFFQALPQQVAAAATRLGSVVADIGTDAISQLLTGLQSGLSTVVAFFASLRDAIVSAVPDALSWLRDVGQNVIAGLLAGIDLAIAALGSFFSAIVGKFIDGFKAGFGISSPAKVMLPIGQAIIEGIIEGARAVLGTLGNFLATAVNAALGVLANIGSVASVGQRLIATFAQGVLDALASLGNVFTAVASRIVGGFGSVLNAALTSPFGVQLISGLANGLLSALGNVLAIVTSLPGRLIGAWNQGGPLGFARLGVSAVQNIAQGVTNAAGALIAAFTGLPSRIISAIGSLGTQFVQIGRDMVAGILEGLADLPSIVGEKLRSGLGGVVDSVKGFLGISSPSKVTAQQVGLPMAQGVASGFTQGGPQIVAAVKNTVQGAVDNAAGSVDIGGIFGFGVGTFTTSQLAGAQNSIAAWRTRAVEIATKQNVPVEFDVKGVPQFDEKTGAAINAGFTAAFANSIKIPDTMREAANSIALLFPELNKAAAGSEEVGTAFQRAQELARQFGVTGQSEINQFAVGVVAAAQGIQTAGDAVLGARDAFGGFISSMQTLTQAQVDGKNTLDAYSDAGRANESTFRAAAAGAAQFAQNSLTAGESADVVTGRLNKQVEGLVSTAGQFGKTGQAGIDYVGELFKIPPEVLTNVHNSADLAKLVVQQYVTQGLDQIPKTKSTDITAALKLQKATDDFNAWKRAHTNFTATAAVQFLISKGADFNTLFNLGLIYGPPKPITIPATVKVEKGAYNPTVPIAQLGSSLSAYISKDLAFTGVVSVDQATVNGDTTSIPSAASALSSVLSAGLQVSAPVVLGGVDTTNAVAQTGRAASAVINDVASRVSRSALTMPIRVAVDVGTVTDAIATARASVTAAVRTPTELFIGPDAAASVGGIQLLGKEIDAARARLDKLTASTAASAAAQEQFKDFSSAATSALPTSASVFSDFTQRIAQEQSNLTQAQAAATEQANKLHAANAKLDRQENALADAKAKRAKLSSQLSLQVYADALAVNAAEAAYKGAAKFGVNLAGVQETLFKARAKLASDKNALAALDKGVKDGQRAFESAQKAVGTAAQASREANGELAKAQSVLRNVSDPTQFISALTKSSKTVKAFQDDLAVLVKRGNVDLAKQLAEAGPEAAAKIADAFAKSPSKAKAAEAAIDQAAAYSENFNEFLDKTFAPTFTASVATAAKGASAELATKLQSAAGSLITVAPTFGVEKTDALRNAIKSAAANIEVPVAAVVSGVRVDGGNLPVAATAATVASVASPSSVAVPVGPQTLTLDLNITLQDGTVVTVPAVAIPLPPPSQLDQRVVANVSAT